MFNAVDYGFFSTLPDIGQDHTFKSLVLYSMGGDAVDLEKLDWDSDMYSTLQARGSELGLLKQRVDLITKTKIPYSRQIVLDLARFLHYRRYPIQEIDINLR